MASVSSSFPPSSPLSLLPHYSEHNSSSSPWLPPPALNATASPLLALSTSCFTMTLGVLSNLIALGILARSSAPLHRRTKAPFLQLTAALLLTDLAGHLIPGALALYLHLARGRSPVTGRASGPSWAFCQLFGACMVFFGLCPLLLGGAMAVERWVGITRPLLHCTRVTTKHTRLIVAVLASLALLLAVLPLVAVGSYTPQFPGTWCFLTIQGPLSTTDSGMALAFSGLGLVALMLSLLCNTLSGLALLRARLVHQGSRPGVSSARCSLDLEMMTQLVGITVVSCVCWSPFLILILVSVWQSYGSLDHSMCSFEHLVLLSLRLASWNQILDPWVYILLRRAVIHRVCRLLQPKRPMLTQSSACEDTSHIQDTCLH